MKRPLRSVLIGDVDHYPSEYAFGVNQAMTLRGHWHTTVNIRQDIGTISKRVREMQPDVIWGHMLLWAPGSESGNKTVDLLCLCEEWKAKAGTRVLLHDGDARTDTRFPTDISTAVDLALCNHKAPRRIWNIPTLHWPYFAFYQREIAEPVPEFACDLAFAGRLDGGGIYQARTELVLGLQAKLGDRLKIFPSAEQPHTLFRTPELAASAGAVLGYGRPDRNGWLDVRVFQYPGAGAVLIHDDVGGFLTPWEHYVPYTSGSIEEALDRAEHCAHGDWVPTQMQKIRQQAFRYVQQHHSCLNRVAEALQAVGLTL